MSDITDLEKMLADLEADDKASVIASLKAKIAAQKAEASQVGPIAARVKSRGKRVAVGDKAHVTHVAAGPKGAHNDDDDDSDDDAAVAAEPLPVIPETSGDDMSWFIANRPHIAAWVIDTLADLVFNNYLTCVRAAIKCGKGEMVKMLSVMSEDAAFIAAHGGKRFIHVFLTRHDRISEEEARRVMERYCTAGVFVIGTNDTSRAAIRAVKSALRLPNVAVVVHIDECDHGSGDKQKLGMTFKALQQLPDVRFVMYSATPEELEMSKQMMELFETDDSGAASTRYEPDALIYRGGKHRITRGDVKEAEPFITVTNTVQLGSQGAEILTGALAAVQAARAAPPPPVGIKARPPQRIVVARLHGRHYTALYTLIMRLQSPGAVPTAAEVAALGPLLDTTNYVLHFDRSGARYEHMQWGNRTFFEQWKPVVHVIFIDQTATRSTKLECHHLLYAWHAFCSNRRSPYNTEAQASQRVNYYTTDYAEYETQEFDILVYARIKTWQYAAGLEDTSMMPMTMGQRMRRKQRIFKGGWTRPVVHTFDGADNAADALDLMDLWKTDKSHGVRDHVFTQLLEMLPADKRAAVKFEKRVATRSNAAVTNTRGADGQARQSIVAQPKVTAPAVPASKIGPMHMYTTQGVAAANLVQYAKDWSSLVPLWREAHHGAEADGGSGPVGGSDWRVKHGTLSLDMVREEYRCGAVTIPALTVFFQTRDTTLVKRVQHEHSVTVASMYARPALADIIRKRKADEMSEDEDIAAAALLEAGAPPAAAPASAAAGDGNVDMA